jgi:hypothetical protein
MDVSYEMLTEAPFDSALAGILVQYIEAWDKMIP